MPPLAASTPAGPVALLREGGSTVVRFGGASTTNALVAGDREAWLCRVSSDPIASIGGYPVGRLRVTERQSLGPGSGETMLRWWQVASAAELVGNMASALSLVVQYVKDRVQFGRPLGTLQAIQHRLAEARVRVEGSRLLTYYAAWSQAPAADAALAASHAAVSGRRLVRDLHQFCGAIGLTEEFDLQLWTMRIRALYLEIDECLSSAPATARRRAG
jgi:alkylation response protein AidB-like acyl-CoA dehydrogenase